MWRPGGAQEDIDVGVEHGAGGAQRQCSLTAQGGYGFSSVLRVVATLEGTGAYEGLALVDWATLPSGWRGEGPSTVEGVIYQGSAPRMEWSAAEPSPASE